MQKTALCLLACLAFSGCGKIDFGPNDGIAYRDANNVPGPDDPTDWQADDEWKKVERKLFEDLPVDVKGAGSGGYRSLSLYANPISTNYRAATLQTNLSNTGPVRIKLVVVDRKYRKKADFSYEAVPSRWGGYDILLNFPADKFNKDELYRIYYVFYDSSSNTLRFKGHGDFIIKDM